MELSPQVGQLEKLEQLDLDQTQIMGLPIDIGKLLCLRHLRVSFYPICGKNKSKWKILIHPETLSNLSQLTDLSIEVDPADKRWDDSVEVVVKEVCNLKSLRSLSLYIPEFQLLEYMSSLYPSLSRFRFTVGRIRRRIISRVPQEVESEFRNWDKSFKFVNGENIPIEIKGVLRCSDSFFLDRHATATNLWTEFGIENMLRLKFCLLAECDQMRTIIDEEMHCEGNENDLSESNAKNVLGSLEYLSIYYMENLRTICRGPTRYGCMSKLKFLGLHSCPQLSIVFSLSLLENLINLEELILEDCPLVTTLVSDTSVKPMMSYEFLPSLKRLLLLYLPQLVTISNGGSSGDVYSNRGQQPQKFLAMASDKKENSHDDSKKKLMRKEIERNRRQEMASLYSSLRSLLPLECIKGKRSKSDHLNGAISYIKDLQKRIEKLSARRDELKRLYSNIDQGSSNESSPSNVVVRQSLDGLQVVVIINTGLGAQALSLSRVLRLLLEDGLNVVSCISTRIDGGLVHTIQCEANNMKSVDVHIPGLLEHKLHEEISSLTQISPPPYV
ncbi:hypothetical protein COLO4_28825 [Corchorus olitorius]|uniref:BHLH domain-containing protein n=1 Tax=Corchorus olitorius TaxID=93759 RepID=A0A1R3HI38_9ROSI|nr:hypothetical protein COLO4_28825 [Corchorus olitorius]